MIFGLLAVGVITIAYLSYRNYEDRHREEIGHQLEAVWQLKADELVVWRAERLGDAQVLYRNSAFSDLVQRFIDEPEDAEARRQLTTWLAKYPDAYAYQRAILLDARGTERLSVPATGEPTGSHVIQDALEVMRSGEIGFLDFHRHELTNRVHLALLVPISAAQGGSRPIGVLVLDVDPQTYLYPLLKQWPTPSETAETLLVRREGEEVVFLNELRFREGTALNLRFPVTQLGLPAAAAATGETGLVEGVDYRGVPVMAYVGSIPGSPWGLVARMDLDEVIAPMRARLRETASVIVVLLFGALAGIGLVWRQQRFQYHQARFEAERERAWLQDVIARSLNEIYVLDPETLRFVFANAGACRNIGYSLAELADLTPLDIKPAYTPADYEAMLQPLRSGQQELLVFEAMHRRKDGSEYPVEVHLQLVRTGERAYFLAIVADITERKKAETALVRANRMYALISQVNQLIVRTADADALLRDICRIAVEFGGFRMAWIGMVDEGRQRIRPVAQAGVDDGYLSAITQSSVLDVATGSGQTPTAVREGKTTPIHDIASDPRVKAWRVEALRRGYRSSVALPIRVRGEVAGAFSLYASEAFFFNEEENRLLEEVVADIAFALEAIESARQRTEAQAALTAAHARLRRFVDANIIGVVIARPSGELLEANDYYLRMIGYTREEYEQGLVDWRAITPPEWLPADEHAIEELRQRGVCTPYEKEYLRRDGSRVSVFLSDAMLPGDDEAIAAFVLDITERKRADEALRYHQNLMREMGRVSKVGGWEFDPATGKGTWTEEVARIHELDPDDETNMALGLSFYHGESRARIEQAIREAIELGRPYDLELELTTPSGTHKWVQTIGAPVLVDGRVVNVRGSFQDITERKRAEEELRRHVMYLRALQETTLELLSQPSLDALFENIVRRAGDLVGTTAGYLDLVDAEGDRMQPRVAIGGLSDSMDNPATPGVGVAGVVWQTAAPLIVDDYDSWPDRLPGMSRGRVSSVVGVPLLRGSEVLGVIGLGHEVGSGRAFTPADVDLLTQFARLAALAIERAELLAALQTERNSLATRVRERTAELEQANRELEAFAYSVSHDLRAPLRAMQGFSTALLSHFQDQMDEKGKHYLERIQQASQRMGQLINDMLNLSRITRADLTAQSVDLSRLAHDVAAELRTQDPERRVEFVIADRLTVQGDEQLLRIALENLLDNAWKFTGTRPKAVIEVGRMTPAEYESRGGDWAAHIGLPERPHLSTQVYYVRDNGVGFDMAYAERLFAPFQRLHAMHEFPGTGIGLAIVQRVISRHGGQLWAHARLEQGATFCFTLGGAV
jgi:PAS domain S-box-containing protein